MQDAVRYRRVNTHNVHGTGVFGLFRCVGSVVGSDLNCFVVLQFQWLVMKPAVDPLPLYKECSPEYFV